MSGADAQRRVILLRAVNVGGASLPMAELRSLAVALGATEVATHRASGNLICTVAGDPSGFDRALESAIEDRFGFFREAISRTREDLVAALAAHPFEVAGEEKAHHIHFLLEPPTPTQIRALDDQGFPERLAVVGRDLHIHFTDGVANSRLTAARLTRLLGSPGTARNLRTVRTLIELAGRDERA